MNRSKAFVGIALIALIFALVSYLTQPEGDAIPDTQPPAIIPTTGPGLMPTKIPPTASPPGPTQPAAGQFDRFPYLPDPSLTPGDVLDVTTDDICVSGYSSKVRNVPQSVKNQAFQEYGILTHEPYSYEVDHLISLELGGSNSLRNLWPESYSGDWNARVKDKLENRLHKLICSSQLDLSTAQQEIAANWIAAYQKYIGPDQ